MHIRRYRFETLMSDSETSCEVITFDLTGMGYSIEGLSEYILECYIARGENSLLFHDVELKERGISPDFVQGMLQATLYQHYQQQLKEA